MIVSEVASVEPLVTPLANIGPKEVKTLLAQVKKIITRHKKAQEYTYFS